jgi:hypothetical protein
MIEVEGIAIETIPPALERMRAAPIPDDDLPGYWYIGIFLFELFELLVPP